MSALLKELRNIGYEIYFAGVQLPSCAGLGISEKEKEFLGQYIDHWVADFIWEERITLQLQRINQKISLRFRMFVDRHDIFPTPPGNFLLDEWFDFRWLGLARDIQKQFNFSRILVPYIFSSAFFRAFPTPCLKILDCHDMFSNRNAKIAQSGLADSGSGWFSVSTADERRALKRADVVLGIQDKESDYFRSLINKSRPVYTVSHFPTLNPTTFQENCFQSLGFLGSNIAINAQALTWFLRDIWPHVISLVPQARLVVAGSISNSIQNEDNTICLGEISDLHDFYRQVSFLVSPLKAGTGIKIKTIEAMSYGRMVIATPAGCEGLEHYVGKGIVLAKSEEEYINLLTARLLSPSMTIQEGKLAEASSQHYTMRSRHALSTAIQGGPSYASA